MSPAQLVEIYRQLARLDRGQRSQFYGLHCTAGVVRSARNLFSTNCIRLGGRPERCAVFPRISRANHSCCPTALYSRGELRAATRLHSGMEVTISYISNNWESRVRRQAELAYWRFTCSCPVCTLPHQELKKSDSDRERIRELQRGIEEYLSTWLNSQNCALSSRDVGWRGEFYRTLRELLPDAIGRAEERVSLLENLALPTLCASIFRAEVDLLLFYLSARSLVQSAEVDCRISSLGSKLEAMSQWSQDWREQLCQVTALALLLSLTGAEKHCDVI